MKSEQQITQEWIESMFDECTDEMDDRSIHITPDAMSQYFTKHYELDLSPKEAQEWLSKQKWYQPQH